MCLSEYTEMVETLEDAFNKAIQRFIIPDESDEEISIEYNTGSERKKPRLMNAEKKSKNSAKIIEVSPNDTSRCLLFYSFHLVRVVRIMWDFVSVDISAQERE